MSIISSRPRVQLTDEEKKKLLMLVAEAQNRGVTLPKSILNHTFVFPKDENEYYIKNDGKHFNANENHERFVSSRARFSAFISGRGGGKSASGAQKALKKIEMGLSGMIANPTFEDFKTSTWLEFKEWIPWDMVVIGQRYRQAPEWEPSQPFSLTFVNGAKVSCKGLNNPDSARGPNINWFWYDEAGKDISGEAWQIATASVRVGFEPQSWATTTPSGQNWLYELFVEQNFPDDVLEAYEESGEDRPLVEWFETSIIENKENLDPGFYASILASYPTGYLREQEVYGKFVNPGGILGDPSWFNGKVLPVRPDVVRSRIRYWDLAASEKKIAKLKRTDPDETVGTAFSWDGEADFCIENQVCGHWKWQDIKDAIRDTAEADGPLVNIYIEEEPGSGGKNQVEELKLHIVKELGPQWRVFGHNPRGEGDKIMRANTWFAEASQGRFTMVLGEWNKGFLRQLGGFPSFKHDDRIDSVSGARHCIAPIRTWKNIQFLSV
jgi:predicted phage terminase large subunit-like protein